MKLEFRKNDKMFYVIVGLALLFIIAMYLYHSQKNTIEKFDPNGDELDIKYEGGYDPEDVRVDPDDYYRKDDSVTFSQEDPEDVRADPDDYYGKDDSVTFSREDPEYVRADPDNYSGKDDIVVSSPEDPKDLRADPDDTRSKDDCKKNLDSFLKKYTDFKIVGSWAPNGVDALEHIQIDDRTVVFIGRDDGYWKMIGFDICQDPIKRIKGKAVAPSEALLAEARKINDLTVGYDEKTVLATKMLWEAPTPHDNIGPGYYDLDYNYTPKMVKVWREEGPPWFLSDESCKNIFDGYKKYGNKLSGSWIPGGVKSTLHGVVEHNGKEIVVFAGYHDGYYKMVGYDFCQFPPKRIDGRAKRTKKFRIPTEGDKRFISDFWNSAEHKGIKEGNYNLNLEIEGVCDSGEKKYFDKGTGVWKCPFTPPTISLDLPCPEAQGGGPPREINGELKCPERCDSGELQYFNEETEQFECPFIPPSPPMPRCPFSELPPREINGELKCPERCDDSGLLQEYNEETEQFECPKLIYPP